MEEQSYPLNHFKDDIHKIIQSRFDSEGIDFKDYTQDQIVIRLEYDLSKLPNILKTPYPTNKEKLLRVATDIYYLTSQIMHREKQ